MNKIEIIVIVIVSLIVVVCIGLVVGAFVNLHRRNVQAMPPFLPDCFIKKFEPEDGVKVLNGKNENADTSLKRLYAKGYTQIVLRNIDEVAVQVLKDDPRRIKIFIDLDALDTTPAIVYESIIDTSRHRR